MNRRGFLSGILAGTAAPAVVRSESLMRLWVPPQRVWHTGGIAVPFRYRSDPFLLQQFFEPIEAATKTIIMFVKHDDFLLAPSIQAQILKRTDLPSRRAVAVRDEVFQLGRTK